MQPRTVRSDSCVDIVFLVQELHDFGAAVCGVLFLFRTLDVGLCTRRFSLLNPCNGESPVHQKHSVQDVTHLMSLSVGTFAEGATTMRPTFGVAVSLRACIILIFW